MIAPAPLTIRILHLVSSLHRFAPAGAVLPLAQRLASGDIQQHAVALAVNGPLRSEFKDAPLNFQRIERRWSADPVALGRLVRHARRTLPQIIHAWDPLASEYAKLATPWIADGKLLVEHRHAPRTQSSVGLPLLGRLRSQPAMNVAPLDSIRDAGLAMAKTEDGNPWRVIAPGVESTSDTAASRQSLLGELGFASDIRLIGIACPLEPVFGVKELIWAADMLRVLHPNIRVAIVGEGSQQGHLKRFAQTAAEETDIRFLGDRADWREVIAGCDLLWVGSEPHAEFQLPLLTALAAGVPVVASDTPLHREVITDGETGCLAKLAGRAEWTRKSDALLTDESLAEHVIAAGRTHAERSFSLSQTATGYEELYRELAG